MPRDWMETHAPSCSTPSRPITRREPPGRPRRRCSTTRTSSTQPLLPVRSNSSTELDRPAHTRHTLVTHPCDFRRYPQNRGQGPKAPGERGSRTRVNLLELRDATLDLVAQGSHVFERHHNRVLKIPVQVPLPRQYRARVAATHRNDDVRPLHILPGNPARQAAVERDSDLPHRLDDLRMQLTFRPRTGRARLAAAPLVQGLRHLRAPGISDTDEEHARERVHHATVRSAGASTPSGFRAPPSAKASCSTASGTSR